MSDSFAGRTALTGTSGVESEDNTGYGTEAGEPDPFGGIDGTVWLSFTPPSDGVLLLHTNATGYSVDTILSVYTGASLGALVEVASSDDDGDSGTSFSQLFVSVGGGTEYQIQMGMWSGETPGVLVLTWVFQAPPSAITDSFDRADGVGLGKTDGAFGVQWFTVDAPGATVVNQLGIGSGQAKNYANSLDDPSVSTFDISAGQALLDTRSSDGTLSMAVAAGAISQSQGSLLFRWSNSANFLQLDVSPSGVILTRVVSNTGTVIGSASGLPFTVGDRYAVEFLGDQIRVLCNGAEVIAPVTETTYLTNTTHGFELGNVDWIDGWSFAWPGGWPLRVVSAEGGVWRVGPTENPDGGVMRQVRADGAVWIQDPAGTLPWRLVGAAGQIVEIPMSGGWITPTVEVSGDMRSWPLGSEGDVLDRSDFATSAGEAWAGTGGTGNPYGMSLQSFTVGSNASAGISEGIMSISWRAIMDAAVPAFTYPDGASIDPDDEGSVVSAQVVAQMSETVGNDGPTSIRQIAQADYDVISGPVWQTPTLITAAPVVFPAAAASADPIPVTFDISWDDVGGGTIKAAFYLTSIDNYAPGGGTWDPDIPQTALLEAVGGAGSGNPPQWSATVNLPRYTI